MRYAKPAYERLRGSALWVCRVSCCRMRLPEDPVSNTGETVSFRPNRLSCSKSSGNTILSGPQSRQRLTTPEH